MSTVIPPPHATITHDKMMFLVSTRVSLSASTRIARMVTEKKYARGWYTYGVKNTPLLRIKNRTSLCRCKNLPLPHSLSLPILSNSYVSRLINPKLIRQGMEIKTPTKTAIDEPPQQSSSGQYASTRVLVHAMLRMLMCNMGRYAIGSTRFTHILSMRIESGFLDCLRPVLNFQ